MRAKLIFHKKTPAVQDGTQELAIAELKVYEVFRSVDYPEGIKYSLFLVLSDSQRVVVGLDNHKPKGHQLHRNGHEVVYLFRGLELLISDFERMVREEGFHLCE